MGRNDGDEVVGRGRDDFLEREGEIDVGWGGTIVKLVPTSRCETCWRILEECSAEAERARRVGAGLRTAAALLVREDEEEKVRSGMGLGRRGGRRPGRSCHLISGNDFSCIFV